MNVNKGGPIEIDQSIVSATLQQAALHYHKLGFSPVPIPFKSKAPSLPQWQQLRMTETEISDRFREKGNIGIILGDASQGLADVDLDCTEAITIADLFLPSTVEFGSPSKPRSHRIYISNIDKTVRYQDPEKGNDKQTTLVELRSNGGQTIFPPSINPSGETVAFSSRQTILKSMETLDLERGVALIAVSALLARHWPGEGNRQEAAMALAGGLLRRGVGQKEVGKIIIAIGRATNDEEADKRVQAVASTAKTLYEGRAATGFQSLGQFLTGDSDRVLKRVCHWLKLSIPEVKQASEGSEWTEMKPLPAIEPEVPPLPERLVPESLRPWILDIAQRMQVPMEYVAMPALVAAGSVVGRRCGIRPKQKDDWLVLPNFWGAIVGKPSVLKTPAVLQAIKPLAQLATSARKKFELDVQKVIANQTSISAQMKGIEDQIRKLSSKGPYERGPLEEKLTRLQKEAELIKTREVRYLTSDSTQEKLADLLIENPNGLLLWRDELYGFFKTLDKPGFESARAFFLEAWSGLVEDHRVDRMARGSTIVPALRLAVFGSIQPGRLRDYFADALMGGSGDDGLMQRLQLLVYPPIQPEWELVDRYPNSTHKSRAFKIFESLSIIEPTCIGATTVEYSSIPFLRFSGEAQELFNDWLTKLERRLRSGEIPYGPFESHLGKYRSLMPGLALLFHLVNHASESRDKPKEVGLESAQTAAVFCEFLELHASKVYSGAMHPEIIAAHELAKRIKHGEIQDRTRVRDIYRRNWSKLDSAAKVEAALCVLAASNWIRLEETRGQTGAPSDIVRLHPGLAKGAPHEV